MRSRGRSRRSKHTTRSSRTSRRRSKRATRSSRTYRMRVAGGFTFRAADVSAQHVFEQWGDDTLYPPHGPPVNPIPKEIASQCGVLCMDREKRKKRCLHQTSGDSMFCEFHTRFAVKHTKDYHKNDEIHKTLNSNNAMRIIPLRICVYLMYNNASEHKQSVLTPDQKTQLEKTGQTHLEYVTRTLLPHWDKERYGPPPESADALVTSFLDWEPKVGEVVKAKFRPQSNWKTATVVALEGNDIKVRFHGYDDATKLSKSYVKPSYFAMPPKTAFVQYVLDDRPCVMLLKGSGFLRNMEWSCLPDQPIWDLLAIIFNGKHIMFTNIVSKKSKLEGEVVLPLLSSMPEKPGETLQMSVWYTLELLNSDKFAEYMNDEFSEVMFLYDAQEKRDKLSINVDKVFATGTVTSNITDKVAKYHADRLIADSDSNTRARLVKKYLSESKKHLVRFTLSTPIPIPEDSVLREMVDIYMTEQGINPHKRAELLSKALDTSVTKDELEYYERLVLTTRSIRRVMNGDEEWLQNPKVHAKTIELLQKALGELVLKSQLPERVQKFLP